LLKGELRKVVGSAANPGVSERASEVYAAVRGAGVQLPLVVRVDPTDRLPFGGW
jgi:hypothetical protein